SQEIVVSPPEDAPLSKSHWMLMGVLAIALVIDIMKPASLGFTIPGMVKEYGVSKSSASLVPFFALTGTVIGSIVWGIVADIYGRKASILLSAVMFVGTSICGAMPSLYWNVGMCFMMGAAAGGMLPVTYALLAEMMPSKHRGWALVLVGGLGAVGGYFAASGFSALLQPTYGWRILWLLNLQTGLSLVLLGALMPESALIAFPTVFIVAYLYSGWSTKWSVVGSVAITLAGLAGVLWLEFTGSGSPVLPVALLIVGTNALIAMLLPYAAESFPLRIRGRTTGTVA